MDMNMNMLARRKVTLCALIAESEHSVATEEGAGNRQILDIGLPDNRAIPLLDKRPRELKANTKIDICTPIFTAASVTAAKREQQQSV